ncbi:MAG: hypothetical protein ABIN79_14315 [Marmoricola sp.]
MSRLIDPTICPDCRGPLDPSGTCVACGLHVSGPLAAELWVAMQGADRVVEQLRIASPPMPPVPAMPRPGVAVPHAAPRRRLPALSIPVLLLSVGALCLLVAAVVFVAVTWSVLGLTGRTLVLLAITGGLAAVATVLTRKPLRGGAETFWLITGVMLSVDLIAAESAGLAGLDALSWRGTAALVGVALFVLGVLVATWSSRQRTGRLITPQVIAVAGALVLTLADGWFASDQALGTTVAILLLVVVGLALRRLLPLVAGVLATLAAASWVVLLMIGWGRATETSEFGAWWADGRGWPLLVAAAFAAVAALVRRTPAQWRSVPAGLALLSLVIAANAPLSPGHQTRDLLIECGTLVTLAALVALAPLVWARAAAVLTALGLMTLAVVMMVAPWDSVSRLDLAGQAPLDLTVRADQGAAAWTVGAVALAIVVALAALTRLLPRRPDLALGLAALAAGTVALGVLDLVLALQPPLWAAVATGAAGTAIAAGAAWMLRDHLLAAILGSATAAFLASVTLVLAAAADLLAAMVPTLFGLVLVLGLVLRDRAGRPVSAALLGALGLLLGGQAVHQWTIVLDLGAEPRALSLAVYAALVSLVAAPLTRSVAPRIALEATGLVLAGAALWVASDETVAAMVLTVLGAAICLVAVANQDRFQAGWLGAGVLGIATILRVDAGVAAPELYTLPAAGLLVAAGIWRLRKDPESSSMAVLGSGLSLALLPSLLLALDEPVSLRGALIGAGGVLVLAAGVRCRLSAPLVLGAGTTAVLALRHLGPVAEAVPRWISLGMLGVALLVVGLTWEARLTNLGSSRRYLAGLR